MDALYEWTRQWLHSARHHHRVNRHDWVRLRQQNVNLIFVMVCSIFCNSLKSGGIKRPWRTEQKAQLRVQTVPKIMNVKTPFEKHSPRFGQRASWQMELGTSFSNHCDNFLVAFALVLFCFNHWGNRIGAL